MPYITVMQAGKTHQVTFEDILLDRVPFFNANPSGKTGGTVTFFVRRSETMERHLRSVNVQQLIAVLETFNSMHEELFAADRQSLYHTFYIPKHSRGFRRIDEPLPQLMDALRQLKTILEERFNALYHTSAFAYIKGRSTIDAIRKHQQNKSRWFLKTDFSDFFGSTSEDFVWNMFSRIFPFSEVAANERGAAALRKALSLCFLNGGLPQGTPVSPTITNIMMIPFDHMVTNELVKKGYIYTRYADDILISHRESFDYNAVCKYIEGALTKFKAPFSIKPSKTRYGSSSGRNWNLGVMLNKDNKITVGRKKKEYLKAACNNYVRDKKDGINWDPHDVSVLRGNISYYEMVEPDYLKQFLDWFNGKNGVNLKQMLRDDLR